MRKTHLACRKSDGLLGQKRARSFVVEGARDANLGLPGSLLGIGSESLPFSCIKVERELHKSIVNPGKCYDFMLQRKTH